MNVLPHNIDAEESVIGSLLIDSSQFDKISLVPSDFYVPSNAVIFQCCCDLKERGSEIDQVTVSHELQQQKKLASVGGDAYLSQLITNIPTSLHCRHYAEIVKRLSILRQVAKAAKEIEQVALTETDATEALTKADELLLAVRKNHNGTQSMMTPKDKAAMLLDHYAELSQSDGGIALKTGIIDLDKALGGGLYNGNLVVIGARPGLGKTTFLRQIANHIATTDPVAFFSAEMNITELADRDIASSIGVPVDNIRLGGYNFDLMEKINNAVGMIGEGKVYDCDLSPLTTPMVAQQAIAMQTRYGVAAVFVDYLGMLEDKEGENQNVRIGYITRQLKSLARKLNVPVVVACQLNRGVEHREDKRPMLSDLRESGNIEQDADIVIFLYRDSYYMTELEWKGKNPGVPYPANTTEILIAKQRQGQSNKKVDVIYDQKHQLLRDKVRVSYE